MAPTWRQDGDARGAARRGFTLVELLVVIVILGMLMGLLIPVVSTARESARRATCLNNQREVAAALLLYENRKGRFPGYVNDVFAKPGSWVVPILPELGRGDIYAEWTKGNVQFTPIAGLICPSNPPDNPRLANLSYAVNCGLPDGVLNEGPGLAATATIPADWQANGIFHDHFTAGVSQTSVSIDFIARCDGTSTTLLLGENVAADTWQSWDWRVGQKVANPAANQAEFQAGLLWCPLPPEHVPPQWRVNGRQTSDTDLVHSAKAIEAAHIASPTTAPPARTFARPSSLHPGGAVVAFADGRVIFWNEAIDYSIYAQSSSPDGKAARQPGVSSSVTEVHVGYRGPLDESSFQQ